MNSVFSGDWWKRQEKEGTLVEGEGGGVKGQDKEGKVGRVEGSGKGRKWWEG